MLLKKCQDSRYYDASSKRRRVEAVAKNVGVSIPQTCNIAGIFESGFGPEALKKVIKKVLDHHTPYGNLLGHVKLETSDGDAWEAISLIYIKFQLFCRKI